MLSSSSQQTNIFSRYSLAEATHHSISVTTGIPPPELVLLCVREEGAPLLKTRYAVTMTKALRGRPWCRRTIFWLDTRSIMTIFAAWRSFQNPCSKSLTAAGPQLASKP
jgi:hypothetical protein